MMVNPHSQQLLLEVEEDRRPEDLVGYFKDLFSRAQEKVNRIQVRADTALHRLATGQSEDLRRVMTAAEEANRALQLTIRIRHQLLESYAEIRRMQV